MDCFKYLKVALPNSRSFIKPIGFLKRNNNFSLYVKRQSFASMEPPWVVYLGKILSYTMLLLRMDLSIDTFLKLQRF